MKSATLAMLLASVGLLAGCLSGDAGRIGPRVAGSWDAFLWEDAYRDLLIEVHFAEDYPPSEFALGALAQTARQVTGKHIVTLADPTLIPKGSLDRRAWTVADLREIAAAHSNRGIPLNRFGFDDTAVYHVYYVTGYYEEVRGAHGVTIDGRGFLFSNEEYWPTTVPPIDVKFERGTLIHEFGHALGLVNCGIPMIEPRERADSRCHSENGDSVMSSVTIDVGSPDINPWRFDGDDLADLAAHRARGAGART